MTQRTIGWWLLAAIAVLFIVVAFIVITTTKSHAHDWYEPSCCSGTDCAPVEDNVVIEDEKTGAVTVFGEVIGPGDSRLRWSRDNQPHVCAGGLGGYGKPKIFCVYRRPKLL